MSIVRQDAWSNDEDLILAEVVLRYIREGGTQLSAFEEVGERLSRTAAACGFRWNSTVRKKYESAITIAKKQRKKLKKEKLTTTQTNDHTVEASEELDVAVSEPINPSIEEKKSDITMDDVISFLTEQRTSQENDHSIQNENEQLKKRIETLEQQNEQLTSALTQLESKYESVNQDYKALIGIIDRARKMAVLTNEEQDSSVNGSAGRLIK